MRPLVNLDLATRFHSAARQQLARDYPAIDDQTLSVTDTGGAFVTVSDTSGAVDVTITDNDTATITFDPATSSATEGGTNAMVGVKLTITGNGMTGVGTLGAAVADVVLAVPFDFFTFKNPLPAGADRHIAAVALFGNGIAWVGPISNFSPVYGDRTIELCHGADPICNPADPDTWRDNWPAHLANAYVQAGMANQAADFVAARI